MKIFKKVIGITFRVILIIILLLLVMAVSFNLILNIQKNNGEDRPNIFGFAPISVTDNKLSPNLNEGDFIIISNSGKYEIGDIITIEKGGEFITQMIVGIEYYEGRDDVKQFNLANHSSVTSSMIYGKMVVKFSGFASVVSFFQTVPGVSILIGIAILIIFMPSIISSFKKDENKSKTKK